MLPGRGVCARVGGQEILTGNLEMLTERKIGMIDTLKSLNVQPVLLTGDNERAASAIAGQLHIEEVHADCLPEDKLNWIDAWLFPGVSDFQHPGEGDFVYHKQEENI